MYRISLYPMAPIVVVEIEMPEVEPAGKLSSFFYRLAQDATAVLTLTEQPFIASPPDLIIDASAYPPPTTLFGRVLREITVRRVPNPTATVLQWRGSTDDWDDVALLVRSLAASSGPGHQYLSGSTADDAMIVLSKGEHRDRTPGR